MNKVRNLSREQFELKNKYKTQKCKEEIEIEDGYTYFFVDDELYFKLKNTEKEEGNRYT